MVNEMNPTKWMGLIMVIAGLGITAFLFVKYGSIGLVVGLFIFLVLFILYLLWVRTIKAKIDYETKKMYIIKRKSTHSKTDLEEE